MGNPFIPFPRCENIIIVGDAAAEYLGALRIYGRGLIGGTIHGTSPSDGKAP